jgi:hypothetical protein
MPCEVIAPCQMFLGFFGSVTSTAEIDSVPVEVA